MSHTTPYDANRICQLPALGSRLEAIASTFATLTPTTRSLPRAIKLESQDTCLGGLQDTFFTSSHNPYSPANCTEHRYTAIDRPHAQTSAIDTGTLLTTSLTTEANANASTNSPTSTNFEACSMTGSDEDWAAVYAVQRHAPRAFPIDTQWPASAGSWHTRVDSDSSGHNGSGSESLFSDFEQIGSPVPCQADSSRQHRHSDESQLSVQHISPLMLDNVPTYVSYMDAIGTTSSSVEHVRPTKRLPLPCTPLKVSVVGKRSPKKITKSQRLVDSPTSDSSRGKGRGKRRGPLRPEQREKAQATRRLGACLRCKFLKKTCNGGDGTCNSCLPQHVRLWQVPCTRLDIRELGYFIKHFTCDYDRRIGKGKSTHNIVALGNDCRLLYITHGYGVTMPVYARTVYVADERCFGLKWTEPDMRQHSATTARLSIGHECIDLGMLSEYLDQHIEQGFDCFLGLYLEGNAFLIKLMRTAYQYYMRTRDPAVHTALRLFLAYTLTMHITFCEGLSEGEAEQYHTRDTTSRFHNFTCAPSLIGFQVKCALAATWRDLHRDVLDTLSNLYTSVYQGQRLRHWPTIFMINIVLLAVWEMMQFDAHYRLRDAEKSEKFCSEMEGVPVGVVVGLFQAIGTKMPDLDDWDTARYKHLLHDDADICDALTDIKGHVREHGTSHVSFGRPPLMNRQRTICDIGTRPSTTVTTLIACQTNFCRDWSFARRVERRHEMRMTHEIRDTRNVRVMLRAAYDIYDHESMTQDCNEER